MIVLWETMLEIFDFITKWNQKYNNESHNSILENVLLPRKTDRIGLKTIRSHHPSEYMHNCFAQRWSLFEGIIIMKIKQWHWSKSMHDSKNIIQDFSLFRLFHFSNVPNSITSNFLFKSETKSKLFTWTPPCKKERHDLFQWNLKYVYL